MPDVPQTISNFFRAAEPKRYALRCDCVLPESKGPDLKLCDDRKYFVFPAYGSAFRNMMPWLAEWSRGLGGKHQFWHGFNGGGVLAVSNAVRSQDMYRLVVPGCHAKGVYGMVLGNEAGERLAGCITCVQEEPPPPLLVMFGLAKGVPDPTVTATAEHLAPLGDDRYLLVVPDPKQKTLKYLKNLAEWFKTFDVEVDPAPCDVRETFGDAISDWFGDPTRTMYAYRISGGEDNAAWQSSVMYYIAEYWDTKTRGLDSVPFRCQHRWPAVFSQKLDIKQMTSRARECWLEDSPPRHEDTKNRLFSK